jgi:hypothetical protein
VLASLLAAAAACATTAGAGAGPAASAGEGGAGSSGGSAGDPSARPESGCFRDVRGDLATIRARLEKGRPDEARVYVLGLEACPEALGSVIWHELAAETFEALGELNAAWSANTGALRLAEEQRDGPATGRIAEMRSRFSSNYAQLLPLAGGGRPPEVRYAGPVVDDATRAQLGEIAAGRAVELAPGAWGFWIFPGSYLIDGRPWSLQAGQRFTVPAAEGR